MIDKLSNNIILNDKIKSVYNFNVYSIQDLLSQFFSKINETVDTSNKALDFLTYLKGEGLPKEVIKELNVMYQDGRLTNLINDLSGDLEQKIEDIKTQYIPNTDIDGGEW